MATLPNSGVSTVRAVKIESESEINPAAACTASVALAHFDEVVDEDLVFTGEFDGPAACFRAMSFGLLWRGVKKNETWQRTAL